jgi:hypothetical protein
MKHLLQFAAVVVVALLAIPPALAEGLCLITQAQQTSMECCANGIDHIGAPTALSTAIQNCEEGCCSVAPQNPPAPIAPDKFQADSPWQLASHNVAALSLQAQPESAAQQITPADRTQDLPVLLHTFRI